MATMFFTGFPGFLGSQLVPRVLERDPEHRAVCLVQAKYAALARERAERIVLAHPELDGRIDLVEGDITRPGLGLDDAVPRGEVAEIYHLAAVYDLSVPREVGLKINLEGTRYVLDFAVTCPRLERFQYVSTCYVSGRWTGIFGEEDLEKGQEFNNFYEETKFLAEVEVQERMRQGLPATIYRPSIVVGDSRTGETQKFDGPYFIIRWILRQPLVAMVPVVGDPSSVRVNLVPRDFVIEAMSRLSGMARSAGKVYQLADPEPLTVAELLDEVGRATGRRLVKMPVIPGVAKAAVKHLPGVHWLMQIPAESIDYFTHPTHYTTTNTRADLDGDLSVPPLAAYIGRIVDFARRHPEIGSAAMT